MTITGMTPEARTELGWLQRIFTADYAGPGHVVREILPGGYPAYVRILHPFVNANDDSDLRSWASMAAQIGLELHGETSHLTLAQADVTTGPRRWMTRYGLLLPPVQHALSSILSGISGTESVYFGYITSATAAGGEDYLVTTAPLNGIDALRDRVDEEIGIQSGPDYWWPRDHTWVVCSDHDLASTYVACSDDVARAILAHTDVEALCVAPETRIDFASDRS